jgi:hypothetical protein
MIVKIQGSTNKFTILYQQKCQHIPITINDKVVSHSNTAKYLGMTLEGTCQEKTLRTCTKRQENVLAHGKKTGPVDTQ